MNYYRKSRIEFFKIGLYRHVKLWVFK